MLTRIVIRVLDDRCTTRRSEMTRLTPIPTSTFHTIDKTNVSVINARSTHARILYVINAVVNTKAESTYLM